MRSCLWTFLFACIVLLASPWQGAAHAAMAPCHGQLAQQADTVPSPIAADAHHSGKADKCNLCSPCCAGVLLDTVQLPRIAAAASGTTFPEPASANPAPLLAGLDRPPRQAAI